MVVESECARLSECSGCERSKHEDKRRVVWVDVGRVLATVLIVGYHMPSSEFPATSEPLVWSCVKNFFCGAGGPLLFFFVLSGYFAPKSISSKWMHRIVMLLAAYVAWNCIFAFGLRDEVSLSRIFGLNGKICADYPMWYVLALAELILCQLLGRIGIYILGVVACWSYWQLGTEWPIPVRDYIIVPNPQYVVAYVLGYVCSCVSLARIQRVFLYGAPVLLLVRIFDLPAGMHETLSAGLLLSAGSMLQVALPCVARWVAALAPAAFLCYAMHAGVILGCSMLLVRFSPQVAASPLFYGLLPFVIYAASMLAMVFMRRYTPALLPLLAYSGRLGWLEKLLNLRRGA